MGNIFSALRAGKVLKNAESWGNKAAIAQAVASILSVLVALGPLLGLHIPLDAVDIQQIGGAVAAIGFAAFTYTHVATNTAVGLPADPGDRDAGVRTDPEPVPPSPGSGDVRGHHAVRDSEPPETPRFTG